jgi:glyoxylase I family protein
MVFEHFALNVPEAKRLADWYVNNCNMKIVYSLERSPFTHFLADSTGRVVMEIYTNQNALIPDYFKQHPLLFHFAFEVENPQFHQERLIRAGATFFEEVNLDDGSKLIMLRDPWGIPLQLCKRGKRLI